MLFKITLEKSVQTEVLIFFYLTSEKVVSRVPSVVDLARQSRRRQSYYSQNGHKKQSGDHGEAAGFTGV